MNRRDFVVAVSGTSLLGSVNAYDAAGKASTTGRDLERLRLCADFVNAAFKGWACHDLFAIQYRHRDEFDEHFRALEYLDGRMK